MALINVIAIIRQCEHEPVDIEDIVELFLTRKQNNRIVSHSSGLVQNAHRPMNKSVKAYGFIPLLVCDIRRIQHNCSLKIYDNFISLRSCVLYGRIVSHMRGDGKFHKYMVDDGTGVMEISIFKKVKKLQTVLHLQEEVAFLKQHCTVKNKRSVISNCMSRILKKTSKQVSPSSIPLGSKVFIYGRPLVYRGQITIDAFNICIDSKNLEIAFKDHLINWYKQKQRS